MKKQKQTNLYYTYSRPEIVGLVPVNAKRILDVGCGEGRFSLQFKGKMETWGIEMEPAVAEIAKNNIDKVLVGDVLKNIDNIPNSYFDCIIFNDVLEHITDPYTVLRKMKDKLNYNGIVICSIPNIRHISVLKKLLINKQWKYEDFGIMDRTHFRFFTYKSIIDMFVDAGYQIVKIKGINGTSWWKFFPINVLTLGFMSDTRYIQFVCVAKPK